MLKHTTAKDLPAHMRLSEDQTTELADMFRLMSDPSRLRIILACLETPVSVGDMANQLGLSASLVSHHLRLLRAGRLLQAERRGNRVFYLITDEHIRRVLFRHGRPRRRKRARPGSLKTAKPKDRKA